MISWLKKHFIPHESNDHRPHILHRENIRNIIILVLLLEVFTFLIPVLSHINTTGQMAAVLPAVLSALTNEERQSQNLQTLTVNDILNKAAEMKATDMATKGYFAHTSPEGKTPWYWLEQVGYQYQYAGENLAINFSDSKDVASAWMISPTHKANIVKGNYTEIGTGIANGIYEGRETVFVAQIYANPLLKAEVQSVKTEVKLTPARNASSQPAVDTAFLAGIADARPHDSLQRVGQAGGEIIPNVVTIKELSNVLGVEVVSSAIEPVQKPTFLQKLFASPRNTMNTILFVMFGIIALALLLYIFIKMKNHHVDLITNGLIVFAIIGVIFITNYYVSHRNMVITQSLDYSN